MGRMTSTSCRYATPVAPKRATGATQRNPKHRFRPAVISPRIADKDIERLNPGTEQFILIHEAPIFSQWTGES